MVLRAIVRDVHDDAFVVPIDVTCHSDFAKVERAAAAWARRALRAMPLYGPARTRAVRMDMEWVQDTPADGAAAPASKKRGNNGRQTSSVRSGRGGRRARTKS